MKTLCKGQYNYGTEMKTCVVKGEMARFATMFSKGNLLQRHQNAPI